MILRGIFHVVSCFPLHFMLYRGNLGYLSDSVKTFNWFVKSCIVKAAIEENKRSLQSRPLPGLI